MSEIITATHTWPIPGFLDARDINAGSIEHPTARSEVVLHVDHEHGQPPRVDVERLRSRIEGDH